MGLAACTAPAQVPSNRTAGGTPPAHTANLPGLGDVAIDDGALVITERGSGDTRVHLMIVSRDCHAVKTSWDDKPGPRHDLQTAAVPISDEECKQIRTWSEQLWQLAPTGRRSFPKPPPDGHPPYLWATAVRRGDAIREVDGGASTGDSQPDFLEGLLDFVEMNF